MGDFAYSWTLPQYINNVCPVALCNVFEYTINKKSFYQERGQAMKFNEFVNTINLEDIDGITVNDLRYFLLSVERAFDEKPDLESDRVVLVRKELNFFSLDNRCEIERLKDTIEECHDIIVGNDINYLRFDYNLITITVRKDSIEFYGTENDRYYDDLEYKDFTLETATNLYIKSFATKWG